jgi:hypothetical protein
VSRIGFAIFPRDVPELEDALEDTLGAFDEDGRQARKKSRWAPMARRLFPVSIYGDFLRWPSPWWPLPSRSGHGKAFYAQYADASTPEVQIPFVGNPFGVSRRSALSSAFSLTTEH